MQAHLARIRARRRRRWLRRVPALVFGLVLGLLQIALVLGAGLLQSWSFAFLAAITLALLFYLLISALAGFQAARQSGNDAEGIGAGCLAGGISFLVIMIGVIVFIALLPPQCQPSCGRGPPMEGVILYAFITLEGVVGIFCCLLGGWIGGLIGQRLAQKSN